MTIHRRPCVSIAGGSAISEGGTASFTLTATPAPQSTLTVEVTVEDSGAFAASGESGVQQVTLGTTGTATFDVVTEDGQYGRTRRCADGDRPGRHRLCAFRYPRLGCNCRA